MTTKKGRPAGKKTARRVLVDVVDSRCPRCDSTERRSYGQEGHTQRIEGQGQAPDGRPYSAVLLSPTTCLNCGQCRLDRRYEYITQDGDDLDTEQDDAAGEECEGEPAAA